MTRFKNFQGEDVLDALQLLLIKGGEGDPPPWPDGDDF